jgi:hypothetical protein
MKNGLLNALKAEDLLPQDPSNTDEVIQGLISAIENYHSAIPREISNTRKELRDLVSTFEKAHEQLLNMSPQAIQIYCNALDAPKGQSTAAIHKALTGAKKAMGVTAAMNNREHNSALNILACDVARIMKVVMQIHPALTRDTDENITVSNGGAAYGRLLRKVAIVGQIDLPDDLYPLMSRGIELLNDPYGNNNTTNV